MTAEPVYTLRGAARRETEKAFLVESGPWNAVWLPKSLVKYDPAQHTFAMPLWLAFRKELV